MSHKNDSEMFKNVDEIAAMERRDKKLKKEFAG